MKVILFLCALLASAYAAAAPFAQAAVVAGVTSCNFSLDGGAKVNVLVAAGLCKFDLSGVSSGSHNITVTAVTTSDPIWGTQESAASSPLAFSRPAAPTTPSGLQLVP